MKWGQAGIWRTLGALVMGGLLCSCTTTEVGSPSTAGTDSAAGGVAAKKADTPQDAATIPVVMILVDEKNLGTIPTAEVEALGASLLIQHGCRTLDQDMARSGVEQRKRLLQMAGDNRGAAALGLQYGANVVLVGDAVCKPGARRIADTNLRTYQAVATLRAVRTDDASVLASASEVGTAMDVEDVRGGSKALKAAAQANFDKLLPATLAAWKGGGTSAATGSTFHHPVELTIGGVEELWKVKAIRDVLRRMQTLDAVVQRAYTAGAVVFEAHSKKPAEELAEDLVLEPPQGLKLKVLSVEAGKIVLQASTT